MKLIVTADDYGITWAGADGVLMACRRGILTQTGLFSNTECAKYAVERMIHEFPNICLGIDINIVCGNPVSDPKDVPTMVNENGSFRSSKSHREEDITNPNHIPYEEAYLEVKNQVEKFIELAGKKPEYLNGHSYSTSLLQEAMKNVANEYDIPILSDILKRYNLPSGGTTAPWNIKPFPLEAQVEADPVAWFKEGKLTYLDEALKNDGITHIHVHAGYVDADTFKRSSYTVVRAKDLELITCPEILKWVKDNHVELISVRDLI